MNGDDIESTTEGGWVEKGLMSRRRDEGESGARKCEV